MSRPTSPAPLETLYEGAPGAELPLPPELRALYGTLRLASGGAGPPRVIANLVETLDGVVALDDASGGNGGDISGGSAQDRAVMGLLRAAADAVVVGAGTLRAVPNHRWTAEHIYAPLAGAYRALRAALGKPEPPLNVIVSASGELDLGLPVFASGEVPALIVTTERGRGRLSGRDIPASTRVAAVAREGAVTAAAILRAVGESRPGELALVEGGPRLMAAFFGEGLLDELFLTLAPRVAGRDAATRRLALVEGVTFAPDALPGGALLSVRRGGDLLFLRYGFGDGARAGA